MARNLVSLQLSHAELSELDSALDTIERLLGGLVSLTPDTRRYVTKMGEKSEVFCRQTLRVLANNPAFIPPNLDLAEAMRDLEALDQLRPRMLRLARLTERTDDTEMALGADLMQVAMEGYALLKVSGRAMGLDGLRKELGARFARSGRGKALAEGADASVPGG